MGAATVVQVRYDGGLGPQVVKEGQEVICCTVKMKLAGLADG